MKRVAILGSTGSVGQQVLNIIQLFPEKYDVIALAVHGRNEQEILKQIQKFTPSMVAVYDQEKKSSIQKQVNNIKVVSGKEGLIHIATHSDIDLLIVASSGIASLPAVLAAIRTGKNIAIANKEILVVAGEFVCSLAKQHNVAIFPLDSEHNAIYQCLEGRDSKHIRQLVLTASGGNFWNKTLKELEQVSINDVLNHSVWKMGKKITVDSSTLMNKALELIEAYWLFDVENADLQAVIHPQCIVHGMVEFIDGTVLALMNPPSMLFPIQYALTCPEREMAPCPGLNFSSSYHLDFFPIDEERFPSIRLAKEVLKTKGSSGCFFNAINEVLVERFLLGEIRWMDILDKIQCLMNDHRAYTCHSLEDVLFVDQEARALAQKA